MFYVAPRNNVGRAVLKRNGREILRVLLGDDDNRRVFMPLMHLPAHELNAHVRHLGICQHQVPNLLLKGLGKLFSVFYERGARRIQSHAGY